MQPHLLALSLLQLLPLMQLLPPPHQLQRQMVLVSAALLGLLLSTASAGAVSAPRPPSTFVFNNPGDLILAGGASVQSAPLYSLRSGNPPLPCDHYPGPHSSDQARRVRFPNPTTRWVSARTTSRAVGHPWQAGM